MERGEDESSSNRVNSMSASERTDSERKSASGSGSRESAVSGSKESAESAASGSRESGSRLGGQPGSKEPPGGLEGQEGPPAIPEERMRNFVVRPGFAYFLVTIPLVQGQRFGLGLKHFRNQVIVSKVEDGSMVADIIKVKDRVCDVSSMPVTDKDVCKTMIVRALKYSGEVDMIIERPIEPEAVNMMENALNASQIQEPSVAMAPDVKSIIRRYQEKLRLGHGQMPARKAITDPTATQKSDAPRVAFQEGQGKSHMSLIIGCDRTPSQVNRLQKVKPKKKPPKE